MGLTLLCQPFGKTPEFSQVIWDSYYTSHATDNVLYLFGETMLKWILTFVLMGLVGCAGGWVGPDAWMDADSTTDAEVFELPEVSETSETQNRLIQRVIMFQGRPLRGLHHYYVTSLHIAWRNPPKQMDSSNKQHVK